MEHNSEALVSVPNNPLEHLSAEAKRFYNFHGVQMIGSDFPPSLIETLYMKLTNEEFDAGEFFELTDNQ